MPSFKLTIALAIVAATITTGSQKALAAETDSDPRSALMILEAARNTNMTSLESIKEQIAEADAKLAHWQPLLENSSRLDEWMHSLEGRQSLRIFSFKPDSRSVREALATRVSAIQTQRELLDSDAKELADALDQNDHQILQLKRSLELASARVARASRATASNAKTAAHAGVSGS